MHSIFPSKFCLDMSPFVSIKGWVPGLLISTPYQFRYCHGYAISSEAVGLLGNLLSQVGKQEHILDIPYPRGPEKGQKCLSICLLLCPPKPLNQIKPNLLSDLLTQVGCAIAERGQKCPSAHLPVMLSPIKLLD